MWGAMGIDRHTFSFLRYCSEKKPFGSVATMGRQSLLDRKLRREYGAFCEILLQEQCRAASVDSFDNSTFEGATHIADLNRPLNFPRQFDTVIDCGTLEHIFNVPQGLRNMFQLCVVGGQIIHVSPANNFCGHGFWQLSPELFFSLYSKGFTNTEVLVVSGSGALYEVTKPTNGKRSELLSSDRIHCMCRTIKRTDTFPEDVQQSDYVARWAGPVHESPFIEWLKRSEFIVNLYRRTMLRLGPWNPHLTRRS